MAELPDPSPEPEQEPEPAPATAPAPAAAPHAASPPAPPLRVLHQDDDFVAVSKPSGLLVHRDEHHPDAPAALQTVRDQTGKFLYPFHRLDRATSGILLFAFSRPAAAALQQALAAPDAAKEYLALVRWPGSDPTLGETWSSDRPLTDERDVPRAAHSEFAVEERLHRCALVRCRITTGRHHQIRRHLAHQGRHVLGDTTHGKGRINAAMRRLYGLHRLFLHLHRVTLRRPGTGAVLELVDPMPMELSAVLERLRASHC